MPGHRGWFVHFSMNRFSLITLNVILTAGWILVPTGTNLGFENGATLTGRVLFKGNVPPSHQVKVGEDQQFCGQIVSIQTIHKESGGDGLQQAIVSFSDIKESNGTTPQSTSLRNEHCAFQERVNALRLGDGLEVRNLDPILHNAHGRFGKRTILNVAQVPGGRPFRKTMKYTGQLVIKCDKHDFMKAHVMVFPHPYFSVTNHKGQFRIDSVPPGPHRVMVWHETLGKMEKEIEVPTEGSVTVDFEFR